MRTKGGLPSARSLAPRCPAARRRSISALGRVLQTSQLVASAVKSGGRAEDAAKQEDDGGQRGLRAWAYGKARVAMIALRVCEQPLRAAVDVYGRGKRGGGRGSRLHRFSSSLAVVAHLLRPRSARTA